MLPTKSFFTPREERELESLLRFQSHHLLKLRRLVFVVGHAHAGREGGLRCRRRAALCDADVRAARFREGEFDVCRGRREARREARRFAGRATLVERVLSAGEACALGEQRHVRRLDVEERARLLDARDARVRVLLVPLCERRAPAQAPHRLPVGFVQLQGRVFTT